MDRVRLLMAEWDALEEAPADDDGWGIVAFSEDPSEEAFAIQHEWPEDHPSDIDAEMEVSWTSVQTNLENLMEKFGLSCDKLAEQEGEAEALVTQVLDHLQLEVGQAQKEFHVLCISRLIKKAILAAPGYKRRRGLEGKVTAQMIDDYLFEANRFHDAESLGQHSLQGGSSSSVISELVLPRKGRRRFARQVLSKPNMSKEEYEDRMRLQWCEKVIQVLKLGATPVSILAEASSNPRSIFMGAIGSTRAGTLETYCTSFTMFADHLEILGGPRWPRTVMEVIDYLHVRGSEPCSPSTPQVFLQALCWMERVANIPREDRFGTQDLVKRTVDYIMELVAAGGPPQKQAPRLPLVVMGSLELYVCNEAKSSAKKLKAFSILVKSNATLREDDVQHIHPSRLRVVGQTLVTELLRTKTSGRTKRVKELPVVLWTGASLTGSKWIEVGLGIAKSFGDPARDHLLPAASRDGNYAVGGPLSYSASSALEKCVFEELRTPVFENGVWKEGDMLLLNTLLAGYWTLHSPRAVVPSFLACLEVEKVRADYVGRWSPSGSESYARTFRAVVKALQMLVYSAVRKGDERLEEDDIIDSLGRFCNRKNFSGDVCRSLGSELKASMDAFRSKLSTVNFAQVFPVAEEPPAEVPAHEGEEGSTVPRIPVMSEERTSKYLIVFTRNKAFARLHRINESNCPWIRVQVRDCLQVDQVNETMYDSRCKICWPRKAIDSEDSESDVSNG